MTLILKNHLKSKYLRFTQHLLEYKSAINYSCSHHSSNPTRVFGAQIFKPVSVLYRTAAQGRLLTAG